MRAPATLVVIALLATAASAQEVRTGTFKSDAGWAVTLPSGWKFVERGGTLAAGHDVEPGMLLVAFEPGATEASVQQAVREGLPLEGVLFRARGPARPVPGTKHLRADFDGVAEDGAALVAVTMAALSDGGRHGDGADDEGAGEVPAAPRGADGPRRHLADALSAANAFLAGCGGKADSGSRRL